MEAAFDSRQLAALVLLAESGSVTEAARRLHLTPSAISHALRSLERDAGCPLFERLGRRLTFTQSGEILVQRARAILREMDEGRAELRTLREWGRGRLRLAVSTTACQHLLPSILREFKESFPRCQVEVQPVDTPRALEELRARQVDLAIGIQTGRDPGVESRPLFKDDLQVLVSPLHPWAKLRSAPAEKLTRETLISYPRTSATFQLLEKYCSARGVRLPASAMELGSMEAIKELVKLNLGVCVLAPWIAREDLARGTLVALPFRPPLRRVWSLMFLKNRILSLAETVFAGMCREATRAFPGGLERRGLAEAE